MFEKKQISSREVVLVVTGPLSMEASAEFHRHLEQLFAQGSSIITLDLRGTDSIASSALGKILLFRKRLAEVSRTLRIRGCNETLYKTLQMVNFDSLISIEQ